jgi:hypothetical protein
VGIDLCARVGGFRPNCENRAVRARISRTQRGGSLDWVEGMYLVRGRLEFKGQEVGINPHAREGDLGPKGKSEPPGLDFRERIAGGLSVG